VFGERDAAAYQEWEAKHRDDLITVFDTTAPFPLELLDSEENARGRGAFMPSMAGSSGSGADGGGGGATVGVAQPVATDNGAAAGFGGFSAPAAAAFGGFSAPAAAPVAPSAAVAAQPVPQGPQQGSKKKNNKGSKKNKGKRF
jgi:hypothetical protein